MKMAFLGDSYDVVKRAFICWLTDFGPWHIHPMFTEKVLPSQALLFADFLGAKLVSSEQLTPQTNRSEFFASSKVAKGLFLDPDTGVHESASGKKGPCYITYAELSDLSWARPNELTLVFDQSITRAKEEARRSALLEKLKHLRENLVHGFYYVSHAPILVAAADDHVLGRAHQQLSAYLPESRRLLRFDV